MKNSFVLFGGSGKVGNLVAYQSDGRKLVRSRNFSPANPRTAKQAIQRMTLAAVTSYARAFAKVVDNSFDGYRNGNGSLSRFRSLAMRAVRPLAIDGTLGGAVFYPKGSSSLQPVKGVQISAGSLAAPAVSVVDFAGGDFALAASWAKNVSDVESYRAWLAKLGLVDGDQLTFVGVFVAPGEPVDPVAASYGLDWPLLVPQVARLCFKRAEDVTFGPNGLDTLVSVGGVQRVNPALLQFAEGGYGITAGNEGLTYTDVLLYLGGGSGQAYQLGVIRTSYVDGKQVHSTAFLESDTADTMDGNTAGQVYESYMGSVAQPDVESPYYTENAQ